MALRTRLIVGIATIFALIALAFLPPSVCGEDDTSAFGDAFCQSRVMQVGTHAQAMHYAYSRLSLLLRRRLLTDSLRVAMPRSPAVRSVDGALTVMYQHLSADSARTWLRLAEDELSRTPGTGRRHIVVALQWVQGSGAAALLADRAIGIAGSDTTCYVRINVNQPAYALDYYVSEETHVRSGQFLGICALYARFGAPGRGFSRLAESSYILHGPFLAGRASSIPRSMAESRRRLPSEPVTYVGSACVLSTPRACRAFIHQDRWTTIGPIGAGSQDLVAWLLDNADSASFGRFWRSDAPYVEALGRAYGKPGDLVLQDWLRHRWKQPTAGPRADGRITLATMGWLGSTLLLAAWIGVRRKVGA